MLTSITPLGERGHRRRWAPTAACDVAGSTLGGAIAGAGAALVGAAFGLARALPILAVVRTGSPERLGQTARRLAAWAPLARRTAVVVALAAGLGFAAVGGVTG